VPRLFVPDAAGAAVRLSIDEAHHVAHVLRLEGGDPVIVFDGRGAEWDGLIMQVGKREVTVQLLDARAAVPEPALAVTLAVGLLKGDAMDDVVRDATALGAAVIVPMVTAHGVVPRRARGDEAVARWQRVAVASAKQCGRAVVPEIRDVTTFAEVLRETAPCKWICLEPEYPGSERVVVPAGADRAMLLVGPEGGWSPVEVATARLAGYHGLQLGPRVLRAALAPTVALGRVWAAVSDAS
jgi:16S rRNA (uracil1498-N3)-methyltransferase